MSLSKILLDKIEQNTQWLLNLNMTFLKFSLHAISWFELVVLCTF